MPDQPKAFDFSSHIFTGPLFKEIYSALMRDKRIINTLNKKSQNGQFPGGIQVEDIQQEAIIWLGKWIIRTGNTDIQKLKAYFSRICQNMINKCYKGEDWKEVAMEEGLHPNWIVDWTDLESYGLTDEERNQLLREAWDQFPNSSKCKERLLMRHVQQLSPQEIADISGLSSFKKASDYLSECKKKLRRIITESPRLSRLDRFRNSRKK